MRYQSTFESEPLSNVPGGTGGYRAKCHSPGPEPVPRAGAGHEEPHEQPRLPTSGTEVQQCPTVDSRILPARAEPLERRTELH